MLYNRYMAIQQNKYGNIKTIYNGRNFDSLLEANHAKMLDSMKRAKQPADRVVAVIYQYRIPLEVKNTLIANYVADFYVSFADGHHEVHETKGVKTDVYKLKKKLVTAIYGDIIKEY